MIGAQLVMIDQLFHCRFYIRASAIGAGRSTTERSGRPAEGLDAAPPRSTSQRRYAASNGRNGSEAALAHELNERPLRGSAEPSCSGGYWRLAALPCSTSDNDRQQTLP